MEIGYAINEENKVISISEASKEYNGNYRCCNCNEILIPRKGTQRVHHFAHKPDANCSSESYLHKIAKNLFIEKYNDCLNQRIPFFLDYMVQGSCMSCVHLERLTEPCQVHHTTEEFDLTKYFDQIHLEKGTNGFIADILLSSSKSDETILVEFAVTHKCDKAKIEMGGRIIEISIKSEDDLLFIDGRRINLSQPNIQNYNFKRKNVQGELVNPRDCERRFMTNAVSKFDETFPLKEFSMKEIVHKLKVEKYFKEINVLWKIGSNPMSGTRD